LGSFWIGSCIYALASLDCSPLIYASWITEMIVTWRPT
jgi:hypothetical protein